MSDVRESPALDVMKLLETDGARISFYDPHVPSLRFNGRSLRRLDDLNNEQVSRTDAVVILTDHDVIDFELILSAAQLVVDTRNVYPHLKKPKLFRLGVGSSDH